MEEFSELVTLATMISQGIEVTKEIDVMMTLSEGT